VEALSTGLSVVASDWSEYRGLALHGEQAFWSLRCEAARRLMKYSESRYSQICSIIT
jgi:hypothetical protein